MLFLSGEFLNLLRSIQEKWQKEWERSRIFEADPDPSKPKFFLTVAYPYPDAPQHIGHGRTYSLADAYARFKRMQGYNVLFPMAFHYTGTPILAIAKRLAQEDKELLRIFRDVFHIPEEVIRTLTEPIKLARYFHEEIKQGMKEMGYSIDWRREFTTIDPPYNKFIMWQFHKLHEKGLIIRGRHPVPWCISCDNAVGQHDTLGDVEPEIEEVTLLKFKMAENGMILPVVTFRPETIFGVTNIWVNPEIEYVVADVNGETWVVSEDAAMRLKYQGRKVKELRRVSGREFIGKEAINPVTNDRIPILPATFVSAEYGTGIVMSVPGHAPYDYLALEDLKKNADMLREYGVDPEVVKRIEPISIISIEGFSDIPAKDAVEQLGVKNQNDPKAEEATKLVYGKEFHMGVMKSNTGKYAGLKVSEAKERVREDLIEEGIAEEFYEIVNGPVYCRCMSRVVVKVVEDQWFINYGDENWKELARECLREMRIVPEEIRREFEACIDWLKAKACARRSGLGTPLPWDPNWIIESLSDSTIYMAYYTIAKYINQYGIKGDNLNDEVFDYIFLGKGDPKEISERTGIPADVLKAMREEFLYWYPLDSRHSGRDLVWNHLTFFIFNHVAIFPRELWPKQIVVNGFVVAEGGQKMSKSLGNIIPIREGLREYCADPIRLLLLGGAELLSDTEFSPKIARSILARLEKMYRLAQSVKDAPNIEFSDMEMDIWDKWIVSRVQRHIIEATRALEDCRMRDAVQHAFYLMDADVSKYIDAVGDVKRKASMLKKILDIWVRLLAPFAPHISEEIWHMLGNDTFVSVAKWPEADKRLINDRIEKAIEFIDAVIEDLKEVRKLLKKGERAHIYVAHGWKYELMKKIEETIAETGKMDPKILMRSVMREAKFKQFGKEVTKIVQQIAKGGMWTWLESPEEEMKVLEETTTYIEKATGLKINIQSAEKPEYDPRRRSQVALPGKPAIYIE